MTLSLGFFGAAGTVTGSRFLLETGRTRLLVDCGQFQGLKELRLRNWNAPPFDPRSVDAVVLTHAHIDHSGALPRLGRLGFRGHVYATPATCELAEILLLDAARLQEEDAAFANRKGFSRHHPAEPLFTEQDVDNVLRRFRPVPYDQHRDLDDFRLRFLNAGHILGSAMAEIAAVNERQTLVFSGDVGRYGVPLHRDPEPLPRCDTLVLESTYGDREHDPVALEDQLLRAIRPTLERRGIVLIPSFAVARAQLLGLLIGRLIADGRLPAVPVDVDSPMATDVTDVYRRYANDVHLDDDIRTRSILPPTVRYHRSVVESKALNQLEGPRIIIASSGMLTGGRVLHHLARLAPDPANLIALAGYQAAGTRGRRLIEGEKYLRMHGYDVPVRARVVSLDGFSAHADRRELVRWVATAPERPRNTFIVHGEPASSGSLADALRHKGHRVIEPRLGERFALTDGGEWRSLPQAGPGPGGERVTGDATDRETA